MSILARLLTFIFLVVIFSSGCTDLSWESPKPGTVIAELTNPDKNFIARVIATEVRGTYTFEVRIIQKGIILAEQTISAPVGYHAHIVSITWSEEGLIFSATIDHDFGEDNRVFKLRTGKTVGSRLQY